MQELAKGLHQPRCSQSKVSAARAVLGVECQGLPGQTATRSYCTRVWPCLSLSLCLCDLGSGSSSATEVVAVADEAIDPPIDSTCSYLHGSIAAAVVVDWLHVLDGHRWCLDSPNRCHNPDIGCGSACRVSSTIHNAMIPFPLLP